jgi:FHS family L-fucose permease-like MFS transporter
MKGHDRPVRTLLYTVYFIYFFCGMTQCFEGVFLPEFKEYFRLTYQQQQYTMFAKNIPFLLAVAMGYFVKRLGYKNYLSIAMALYAAGTLLLVPGLESGRYGAVLTGFFLIGVGFNFQLVAGNPLLCALGPVDQGSSRLNLGNALGAVAQIIAPATLSVLIPVTAVTVGAKLPYMERLFLTLGGVLVVIAMVTAFARNVEIEGGLQMRESRAAERTVSGGIWQHPKLLLGFVAITLSLGVEAGFFGFFRNFLEDRSITALSARDSQRLLTVFFAVFAAGRLVGAWLQKRVRPAAHLTINIAGAMACLACVVFGAGWIAVAGLIAGGFFISIFFPTLYALAIEGLGELTGQASGLLTMGFIGCAVLPVLQGRMADSFGLQKSFALGLALYLVPLEFALDRLRKTRAFSHNAESVLPRNADSGPIC